MQSKEPPNFREILQGTETATKVLLGLGIAAVATALFYDSVYWSLIDRRVLTYLVIADHVQTAVYALLVIVLSVGGVFLFTAAISIVARRMKRYLDLVSSRWPRTYNWAPEILAAAMSVVVFEFTSGGFLTVLVGVIWISIIFRRLFSPDVKLVRRMVAILFAWLIMTALVAYDAALSSKATTGGDTVTINTGSGPLWTYEVRGSLLRLVDRGAILKGVDDQILFIPKERIVRIDQYLHSWPKI